MSVTRVKSSEEEGENMLEIEGAFYNAKEIRRLGRNNRDNLVITYTNGEVESPYRPPQPCAVER